MDELNECWQRGEQMHGRSWLGSALALVGTCSWSAGAGGGSVGIWPNIIPQTDYRDPVSIETKDIPWNYHEITTSKPEGVFVIKQSYSEYSEYYNGNIQLIKFGDVYYKAGGDLECNAKPLKNVPAIFYQTCSGLIDDYDKIIDFKMKRSLQVYATLARKIENLFYFSANYLRDDKTYTYPFQWPWVLIVDSKKNIITTFKFDKPEGRYFAEAVKCANARPVDRSNFWPDKLSSTDEALVLLPYPQEGAGLKITSPCRLRFVFNTKSQKGRYFIL